MKPSRKNNALWLLLPALVLSLTSCNNGSQLSGVNSQTVKQAGFPQMPPEGRQPPKPEFCLPSCTENLTAERKKSLSMLTPQPAPGADAKASTAQ